MNYPLAFLSKEGHLGNSCEMCPEVFDSWNEKVLHNLQHFQPCPAQWCRMVLRSRDCLVQHLREVHGQNQVLTLNLKRHCSHCPKFNLPTIPAHMQVKSCPIKPSSETADAPESTRYFVVCFGLSVSLSRYIFGDSIDVTLVAFLMLVILL